MLDNPESGESLRLSCVHLFMAWGVDIAGANGVCWPSILVQTGVYDPAQRPPTHTPIHIAEDVAEAVRWAIDRANGLSYDAFS